MDKCLCGGNLEKINRGFTSERQNFQCSNLQCPIEGPNALDWADPADRRVLSAMQTVRAEDNNPR